MLRQSEIKSDKEEANKMNTKEIGSSENYNLKNGSNKNKSLIEKEIGNKTSTNENLPRLKYSAGAVKATVWDNKGTNSQGEETSYQTISLERVYQDKEGSWKSTNSFRINDLPKVSMVMQKVYQELVLKN